MARVAESASRLAELAAAHDRPVPLIAVGATGAVGKDAGLPGRADIAAGIAATYGRPVEEVMDVPLTGEPAQVADRLAAYADAGARHVVVGLAGGDWREQCDRLAEVRALLT